MAKAHPKAGSPVRSMNAGHPAVSVITCTYDGSAWSADLSAAVSSMAYVSTAGTETFAVTFTSDYAPYNVLEAKATYADADGDRYSLSLLSYASDVLTLEFDRLGATAVVAPTVGTNDVVRITIFHNESAL